MRESGGEAAARVHVEELKGGDVRVKRERRAGLGRARRRHAGRDGCARESAHSSVDDDLVAEWLDHGDMHV